MITLVYIYILISNASNTLQLVLRFMLNILQKYDKCSNETMGK